MRDDGGKFYRDELAKQGREIDRLRAELKHARPVVSAAREYVERLRTGDWLYPGHETELLRALATRVADLPDTTETED